MRQTDNSTGLCFISPYDALLMIFDSVGSTAREELIAVAVRTWVDSIPEDEMAEHYGKALAGLDHHDLSALGDWHASIGKNVPPSEEFLVGTFPTLNHEERRAALKFAAELRGENAVAAGVPLEAALETMLGALSEQGLMKVANEATELYIWDRIGSDN